jgi:hypothetical protein
VRDQNGAAIPKAEVVILEERTGLSRTATADDNGFYTAASVPVGRYSVSSSPSGFKKTVDSGLELHVNENLVVNLTLQVGQVSEVVTVTGQSEQVETRSGEVSSLVGEKQVTELPLNGRNYAQLVLLVPGISPGTGGNFQTGGTGLDSHVDMSVNGNASNQNLWTVDGVNNMDVGSNGTLLTFPSIDSIQEFRVERNSFSAEFGQAQGAVVNLITKGGTNQFHGGVFEFLRNDALNANNFFLNSGGQPKNALRYNNYGGNFSGPVIKDRIFFFYSEEWRKERRGTPLTGRVPTAAEKIGDFTGTLTGPVPHDPVTGAVITKIPANKLSPGGLALLKWFPDPNAPGFTNWVGAPLEPVNTRQDLLRGDFIINSKTNLMVRWINETWNHGAASGNFWGDTPFPTLTSDWDQPSGSLAVKLTNTLGSTSVNEFQFSRSGNDIIITTSPATQALNQDIASKIPTVFPHPGGGAPSFVWGNGGYNTLWHQAPWQNHEDLFIWKDDFAKVMGAHSFKFGALFSHNIKNELANGNSGIVTVTATGAHTGNTIADVLIKDLPLVDSTELDHNEQTLGRWHDLEFYGNDTWKVRSNVTLTLGMRWSRYAQPYSANNRFSNYIPSLFDGKNPLSGLVLADTRGFNRSVRDSYNRGFQPRIGIAWDVKGDGKTAVRFGFGRYLSRSNVIEDLLRLANNPPWTQSVDTGWGGGGQQGTLASCGGTCRSLDTINPGLKNAVAGVGASTPFNAVSTNFRPPESWQWNLSISREVMKNTVVEASYIGNHGLEIWRRQYAYNDVVPSARLAIAQAIRNGQDTTALVNAGRRFPGLGPISMSDSSGQSHYHALQLWAHRRFSDRLSFQAAYTYGHAISNVPLTSFTNATTDPFNFNLDRGDADLDRRQTFVGNAIYILPSFKRFGYLGEKVLGDWQFNAIFSYFGGVPIDVQCGCNTAGISGASFQRPDIVPGVPIYLHTGDKTAYLNPAAFALPAVGKFGNLGRGTIRTPSNNTVDFSVAKNWRFKERYGIQFRSELFNAFNHANFFAADGGLNIDGNKNDAAFGQVTNGNFGRLTAVARPREIQFGLKFSF